MSGKLDASDHRHDLGSHNEPKIKGHENITQIMWPSLYFDKASRPINGIHNSSLHVQAEAIAKAQCQTFYNCQKKAYESGQQPSHSAKPCQILLRNFVLTHDSHSSICKKVKLSLL